MRICFIGDSHLGAIRRAWNTSYADATFFALPGRGIEQLQVQDGVLSCESLQVKQYLMRVSGGLDRIDASYDVYVLHGLHLSVVKALALLREMSEPGALAALSGTPEYRTALCRAMEGTIAVATLHKLRQITDAPVLVSPTPLANPQMVILRRRLVELDIATWLMTTFIEECGAICRSSGATFVPQPPETLADGLVTKLEYAKAPARFRENVAEDDVLHMNAQYGALVIAAILKSAGVAVQSAATSAAL